MTTGFDWKCLDSMTLIKFDDPKTLKGGFGNLVGMPTKDGSRVLSKFMTKISVDDKNLIPVGQY